MVSYCKSFLLFLASAISATSALILPDDFDAEKIAAVSKQLHLDAGKYDEDGAESVRQLPKGFESKKNPAKLNKLRAGKKARTKKESKAAKGALGPDSVSGTFALVGNVGSNDALVLILLQYDGDGEGTFGEGRINVPNPFDPSARFIQPASVSTIEVTELNSDGFGGQLANLELAGVGTDTVPATIQVTKTEGSAVAALQGVNNVPSVGIPGAMGNNVQTARSSGGFDVSSLEGLYGLACISGPSLGFRSGALTFDGEGGFSGGWRTNDPGPDPIQSRTITDADLAGTYAVEDNGFGEMNFNDIGSFVFLVSRNHGSSVASLTGGFTVPSQENGGLVRCELTALEG